MRIELTSPAWEAEVLPLNYARKKTLKDYPKNIIIITTEETTLSGYF